MATASEIKTFIQTLGALAVNECNRRIANGQGFVLPSVCIAQSALETGWGASGLMVRANAYFGIKAGGSWNGAVYRADTWEVANGVSYNTTANFRAYNSLAESVADYYNLIANNSRYSNALSFGTDKSAWKTPKACITAIWAGGYATDTLYVEKIMNTVNARNLTEYDAMITGEGEVATESVKVFELKNLVEGQLISGDSGRSIILDPSYIYGRALPPDSMFDVATETTFVLRAEFAVQNKYAISVVTLVGDNITWLGDLYHESVLTVPAGAKVGFTIYPRNSAEEPPLPIPETGSISFTNNLLPTGDEIVSSAIAYFVKVE